MHRSGMLLGAIWIAAVSACGGGGSSTSGYTSGPTNPGTGNPNPSAGATTVTISDATFQPSALTVAKGTTVTWKWGACTDGGYGSYTSCPTHSVTFDDGSSIVSPTQSEGTFSRNFASTGTFKYHCAVHGSTMTGQITVQ
jgi:plastocyanin